VLPARGAGSALPDQSHRGSARRVARLQALMALPSNPAIQQGFDRAQGWSASVHKTRPYSSQAQCWGGASRRSRVPQRAPFNLTRIKVNADEGLPSVNAVNPDYSKNAPCLWGRSFQGFESGHPWKDSTK
jgi:hypothetical protein